MSEMITREQLEQWRELAEKSSDGEWTIIVSDGITGLDRAFIAAAREAVPALLDEVTRLRAELAALREAQRWIPVGERLPEPDKVVWVYRRYLTGYEVCEGFLSGGDFNWYANTLSAPRIGVTHWMPIKEPEPPTEAQGESNEQEEE